MVADLGPEFPAEFAAADETTQRAVVGYLNTYAGPWGCKASEEDAVLGIIAALWPEWAEGERSSGIYKFRADERLGRVADSLAEDSGYAGVAVLVARVVDSLRTIIGPILIVHNAHPGTHPDPACAGWFRPRCSCGWRGEIVADEATAEAACEAHRSAS